MVNAAELISSSFSMFERTEAVEAESGGVAVRRDADRFTVVGDGLVEAGLMEDKIARSRLTLLCVVKPSWRLRGGGRARGRCSA